MSNYFKFIFPVLLLGISCALASSSKASNDFVNQIIEFKNSIVKDKCDDLWHTKKIEIITALDSRDINSFISKQSYSDEKFKIIQFGPIVLREPIIQTISTDKWSEYLTDWTNLYEFYQLIQNKEVNKEWIDLSRAVHSLLMNDNRRLTKFYNFNLDEKSHADLTALRSKLDECISNVNCTKLDLSKEEISFLDKVPLYSYFYRKYSSATTTEQKRYAISKNLQWIKYDIESRFEFLKNPSIIVEGNNLILPLIAGPFESVKTDLAKIIEEAWSSQKMSLKVKWVADDKSQGRVYKFAVNTSTNGRSFTSARDHLITIANTAKKKSIIHEIGHVLGFQDHYYETFDSNLCGYKTKMNALDVMSDINNGSITESMFSILKKEYF